MLYTSTPAWVLPALAAHKVLRAGRRVRHPVAPGMDPTRAPLTLKHPLTVVVLGATYAVHDPVLHAAHVVEKGVGAHADPPGDDEPVDLEVTEPGVVRDLGVPDPRYDLRDLKLAKDGVDIPHRAGDLFLELLHRAGLGNDQNLARDRHLVSPALVR